MFSAEIAHLVPKWFHGLNYEDRTDRRMMNRYFIHQAALLASPEMNFVELGKALGVTPNGLAYSYMDTESCYRGQISKGMAANIEACVGAERMPVALMRPDLMIPKTKATKALAKLEALTARVLAEADDFL